MLLMIFDEYKDFKFEYIIFGGVNAGYSIR